MNYTYFKFLFINTIKRKPVWITWLLFLFTCTCFIIILPLAAKMNTLQVWANTTMAICQTFLGMTAALFTSVLAINLFKEGNEEGTELIIISKPISRMKIVLTKFILFGVFCIIVNLTAVLISMFTIFLPRTEVRFYWGLVVSMLIGNAVTFAVFGSIAILMSVKFAKVGIIITNVVLSLVFLIYQALTIFCFSIPSKALADNYMAAPSYIVQDRKADGSYTETEVVKFTANILEDKEHPCKATNWQEMKDFWKNQILSQDPTLALNITDIAGQISLSYLSWQIDDYAARQAKRMFAISRFYNYELDSPASPEIISGVENKKTLPWLYTGYVEIPISTEEETYSLYIPSGIGFAGIKPTTATRLRGYTDKIPVGFVRSKEILSQREVYFEQEDWNKYKKPFDLLYKNLFDYNNYISLVPSAEISDMSEYTSLFAKNNDTVNKYYKLVWHSLTGGSQSVLKDGEGHILYDKTSFNINTPDDLNDRFVQFKYYAYWKAYAEQQALLHSDSQWSVENAAKNTVISTLTPLSQIFKFNFEHWMMKANSQDCIVLEPNTETVCYQLILNAWDIEKDQIAGDPQELEMSLGSAKSIMDKTAAIFDIVCDVREKFLFDSLDQPTRNYKLTGETHMVSDNWVPYIISQVLPVGHNMQYFFYTIHPVVQYWWFAVLWGIISVGLFAAGAVVYNKYDVK